MKKRFDPLWRIVVALLLVFALASVVALSGAVLAAATTTITSIPDYVNSLTSITGTAVATNGTVTAVKVRIYCTNTLKYWNGSTETWVTSSATWNDAEPTDDAWDEATEPWRITTTTADELPTWTNGYTYNIYARSYDDDGAGVVVTESFIYDITDPTNTIDDILEYVNELTAITGTATDTSPCKIAGVEVRIQRGSDSKYWNGSSWVTTETWLDATASVGTFDSASEGWKITTTTSLPNRLPTTWGEGVTYTIRARATDKAGNTGTYDTESFTYETAEPVTTIGAIPNYVNTLTEITGNATDTGGKLAGVKVLIQRDSDDKYWTGTSWVVSETWIAATASDGAFNSASEGWKITTNTTPALPTTWGDGETYAIQAKAEDVATNVDSTPATESFTYDTTKPNTTITDISASVPSLTEVTGNATDTPPGKIAGVEVLIQRDSDDKYWNGTSWVVSETWLDATASDGAFDSASEDWEITTTTSPALDTTWGGGQMYNIKARAEDAAGNVDASPATEDVTIGSRGLLWWHWLLIGLGSLIIVVGIILFLVRPRRPPALPEEGYEEGL
ncbi:MAG: hypothetical protein IBX36_00160 [Dehalococcoidia bacterium]|nr:hypothetical protein [Dehalococcoidia bacterium]